MNTTEATSSNVTTGLNTTVIILGTGDSAYWPQWMNICLPIVSIIVFLVAVVLTTRYGPKRGTHIELRLPVIATKDDAIHSNDSVSKRSDNSDNSDRKAEAHDTVSMLQKAKEQAKVSRATRRLNSIRSRVSSSSQYDYSPLDETAASALGNQIEQDSSDDDVAVQEPVENVLVVNVEHHSPPRNAPISSEDSGFNETSKSSPTEPLARL